MIIHGLHNLTGTLCSMVWIESPESYNNSSILFVHKVSI